MMEDTKKINEAEAAEAAEAQEEEIIVYGRAAIDGVCVPTKELEKATEDYPIVLVVHEDFEPVKKGDEIKTPYDAVLSMDEIQIVGPMIRIIFCPEVGYNIEA